MVNGEVVEREKGSDNGNLKHDFKKPGVIAKGENSFYGDPCVTQNANDESEEDGDDAFEDIVEF